MGHRSLPASLLSSAWVLATSTAAGPGGPERTIPAREEEGAGGGPGGRCGGRCGFTSPAGGGAPPSPPPRPLLRSPHPRTREPALRSRPSGWVRRAGGGAGTPVTPEQLMLPACNQSWVSGPYLSTISDADRLSPSLSLPPPRLWMQPQISVSISTSLLLRFIIHGRMGKSPTARLPSLASKRAPGP